MIHNFESVPVPLWRWRKANKDLQRYLRTGDLEAARKEAHTLLSFLIKMGLVDEPDRLAPDRSSGDPPDSSILKRLG